MAKSKQDKKIHPESIISKPSSKEVYGGVPKKKFAYAEIQGWRPTQEDALAWHPLSTELLSNSEGPLTPEQIGHRLWTSNLILDEAVSVQNKKGGSTVSTTVYDGKGNLITSTLGDAVSFAVVYDKKGEPLGAVRLTKVTHKPTNPEELQRIKQAGGYVANKRVNGILGVSRAIGDKTAKSFKAQLVTSESSIDITNVDTIVKDLNIDPTEVGSIQIITTCDGFTEPADCAIPPEDHATYLIKQLNKIKAPGLKDEQDLAKHLAIRAYKEGSQDNISIAIQTLEQGSPFFLGVYDGHGGNEVSHFVADNIGHVFLDQCALKAEEYYEQSCSVVNRFKNFARDNMHAEKHETKLSVNSDIKEHKSNKNPVKNPPPELKIKSSSEVKEQKPLSVQWKELPRGNYNKVYKGVIENQTYVLKIQKSMPIPGKPGKLYKSPTDTPERSIRLWNLINPKLPAGIYIDSQLGKGWVCPFIVGKQASDKEISKELITIFNRTKRIIMDAPGENNFLKTPDKKIVCVDIGMALRIEQSESNQLLAQNQESLVSGKVWSQLNDTYDVYFQDHQKKFPETVATLKALIFIKNNSKIHNAKALEGKPDLIKEFARAYDLQKSDISNDKVTAALAKLQELNPPTIENLKKSCIEELNIYINSRGTLENGSFKASCVTNFFRNKVLTGKKVNAALDLIKVIESPSSTPEQIKNKVQLLLNNPTMVSSKSGSGMQLCLLKCSNILDQEPCDLASQNSVALN